MPGGARRLTAHPLGRGGGGLRPPSLACGAALGPVPGPVPAVVCASLLMVHPPPQGGAPPLSVSPAAGPAGPSTAADARRVLWHNSASPPCPQLHMMRIVCVGVPRKPRGGVVVVSAQGASPLRTSVVE